MDNGAFWVVFLIPPLVIGVPIIVVGMLVVLNQIVGLIVSGTITHVRDRRSTAIEATSHVE